MKEKKEIKRAEKMKGSKGQRTKPPTPTQAIDALIGEKEQRKTKEKERSTERDFNPATGYLGWGQAPCFFLLFFLLFFYLFFFPHMRIYYLGWYGRFCPLPQFVFPSCLFSCYCCMPTPRKRDKVYV